MAGASSGSLTLACCDRCRRKLPYRELRADGNVHGLRVCRECSDVKDPWRLPAPQTENITLQRPRPDQPIPTVNDFLVTEDTFNLLTTENDDNLVV